MNTPVLIEEEGFQYAWKEALLALEEHGWSLRNLIVSIQNPQYLDNDFNELVNTFCSEYGILLPKHSAYTIFPYRHYEIHRDAQKLYHDYERPGGMYFRLNRRRGTRGWGTYFHRMIKYCYNGGEPVNQLANIIDKIKTRATVSKAAYTIVIQKPGSETTWKMGGPCLNYIAVQLSPNPLTLGLLAVYRNHDFLNRAYGNYLGLCKLLQFLASEVNATPGPLTCISSRAYIDRYARELIDLVEE